MSPSPSPNLLPGKAAELLYSWWERFLNEQSEAFGGDREFVELSTKLHEARAAMLADREITDEELALFRKKMEAVAALYAALVERKGVSPDTQLQATRASFRVFREDAEVHFQTLAGDDSTHYRGGLLREMLDAPDPGAVTHRIALDLLISASPAIAVDKVNLLRAQLSLVEDARRRRDLLEGVRHHLARELTRPVWRDQPAIGTAEFDDACRFESTVALSPAPLPAELRGTNRMLPNRPVAGRDEVNRKAVRASLKALRAEGKLFLDRIPAQSATVDVAAKIELNLGIDGPPSVTDPATTYAVLAELLALGAAGGVPLRFTVGDSNGIENAPVGRTSFDVMRETGNYHAALKAALEFGARESMPEDTRRAARASLNAIKSLERASPAVYFGSLEDRVSTPRDLEAAEAAAAPWVVCVDYDQAGFRRVDPDTGPLGRAVWGARQFHIAAPWVTADYRVHITRGVSNHLFAGWTGSLKGLVGLHALGARPADQGMKLRGENPLDVLSAVMGAGSFTGLFAARSGVADFDRLAALCTDERCRTATRWSIARWGGLSQFAAGRALWAEGAKALEAELRRDHSGGAQEIEIMAKMRRGTAALVEQAERASPGFRASLWQGVADGTRAFLLTMWVMRKHIPEAMRDERMGLRIGLLSRLPYRSDLVVQGLPKIGLGGGPDAYFDARDVGVVLAGTDEIAVDVAALRAAEVPGNPWAYNHPIHGALQFGRGPACWEEIRSVEATDE